MPERSDRGGGSAPEDEQQPLPIPPPLAGQVPGVLPVEPHGPTAPGASPPLPPGVPVQGFGGQVPPPPPSSGFHPAAGVDQEGATLITPGGGTPAPGPPPLPNGFQPASGLNQEGATLITPGGGTPAPGPPPLPSGFQPASGLNQEGATLITPGGGTPAPGPPPLPNGFQPASGLNQEGATLITPPPSSLMQPQQGLPNDSGLADTCTGVPPFGAGLAEDTQLTVTPAPQQRASGSGRFGSGRANLHSSGVRTSSSGAFAKLRSGELSKEDLALVEQAQVDPNRQLGERYLLLRELGKGGMGVVWMALDNVLGRPVAVKRLLSNQGAGEEELERFLGEAQACAALRHSGIAAIYDVGEVDGSPFIAMEYVKGSPLHRLARDQEMKPRESARIVCEVSRAIQHAHESLVLHRDLKPHNVLVEESGRAVVLDFGLARAVDRAEEEAGLTVSGAILGTPAYMAPEQANAEDHKIGPRSDVYGLGAVLYECLTGRPPHQGDSPLKVLAQLLVKDPVRPRVVRPKLPRDLETICVKAMEREVERRYESAGALADDLQRYLDDEPINARPPSMGRRVSRFLKRQRVAVVALAVVMLVAAIAGWKVYSVRRAAEDERLAELRVANQRRTQRAAELTARARAELRPLEALSHIESALEQLTSADDQFAEVQALREVVTGRLATMRAASLAFSALPGDVEDPARLVQVNAVLGIFSDFPLALADRVRIQARLIAREFELGLPEEAYERLRQSLEDVNRIRVIDPLELAGLYSLIPALECATPVVEEQADGQREYVRVPLFERSEIWQNQAVVAVVRHLGASLNAALDDRPGDPELLVARSRLRAASGQVSEALGDASRALDGLGDDNRIEATRLEALVAQGRAQCLLGDMRGAAETLEEVAASDPRHIRCLVSLSAALVALGRPVDALDKLTTALNVDERILSARLMRARLREERGDLHGASDDLFELYRETEQSVFRAEAVILKSQARALSFMPEVTNSLGYYYGPMKVGYSVLRYQIEQRDGERLYVVTGETRYGAEGNGMAFDYRLEFDAQSEGFLRTLSFDMQIMGGRRRVQGHVEGDVLIVDVETDRGEQHKRIEGARGITVQSQYAMEHLVRSGEAKAGDAGQTRMFNPVSIGIDEISWTLRSLEKKQERGRERIIYRFDVKSAAGPAAEIMLDDRGITLMSRVGGFYLQLPESETTVRRIDVSGFDRTLALHSLRLLLDRALPVGALAALTLRLSGVVKAPDDPGTGVSFNRERRGVFQVRLEAQSLTSDDIAVQRPVKPPAKRDQLQPESQSGSDPSAEMSRLQEGGALYRTSVDEELIAEVEALLAGERGAVESVRKICSWIQDHENDLGITSEEDDLVVEAFGESYSVNLKGTLRRAVNMCVAAGVPARPVIGFELNQLDRENPEFIPLWWMEIWVGRWISVDVFLNHVPAENLRIACSRSGLDLHDLLGLAMAKVEVLECDVAGVSKAEAEPAGSTDR